MSIVYKITFPNAKVYIGITSRSIADRMYEHKSRMKKGYKNKLYSAMKKYEQFEVDIVEKCQSFKEAKGLEKMHIKQFNSNGVGGYNMTDGGDGNLGYVASDETKKKLSKAHKGVKLSKEHCESLSKARKGLKRKPEFGKKLSLLFKGISRDAEAVANMKKFHANPFSVHTKNQTLIGMWENINDCAKDLNIGRTSISNCLNGLSRTAGGYVFRRIK